MAAQLLLDYCFGTISNSSDTFFMPRTEDITDDQQRGVIRASKTSTDALCPHWTCFFSQSIALEILIPKKLRYPPICLLKWAIFGIDFQEQVSFCSSDAGLALRRPNFKPTLRHRNLLCDFGPALSLNHITGLLLELPQKRWDINPFLKKSPNFWLELANMVTCLNRWF